MDCASFDWGLMDREGSDFRSGLFSLSPAVRRLWEFLRETCARVTGSEKLAMALVVLSRARAAKVRRLVRLLLDEVVERVDWRCLELLRTRRRVSMEGFFSSDGCESVREVVASESGDS